MKVIICDDDPNQRDSIRLCFEVSGTRNELIEFELGADALDYLAGHDADLMFLDMGLPDMDGLDVIKRLRQMTNIPVIVVSGNDAVDTAVKALARGADDYMTKPFEPMELIARVEAITRRTSGRISQRSVYASHGLLMDFDRKLAHIDGNQIELNLTEWDVMKALVDDPGVVVEYAELKERAWGSTTVSDAAVHMAIRRLRQKLSTVSDSQDESLVRSHRGIGYSISSN